MGSPVCVAEKVWTADRRKPVTYILRWYPGEITFSRRWCYASARLGGVRLHTYLNEVPLQVQVAAADAHDLMLKGDWPAVAAFATHRRVWSWWLLGRRAEPISPVPLCDGMPGRDPDQPHAVCGRLDRHGEHPLGEVGRG